jgi:hypothetical protein
MNASQAAMPLMLREIDENPIAWTNDALPADAGVVSVSPACRDELLTLAALLDANPLPLVALRPIDFDLPECRALMAGVREILRRGYGFVLIDRLPVEAMEPDTAVALYWILGNMIEPAAAQKWDGTMKYDVRDTGKKNTPGSGVRSSITKAGQDYHVDNAFNTPPDFVALLCLKTAMSGGVSGIVSFQTAHNKLLQREPELLARLYQPFCFDRQKEHAPDDPALFSRYPVFSYDGDLLRVRFFDSIIQNGYKVAGEEIDELGQRALDTLAAVLNEDGVGREFDFEPGQIQIVDNRRTAFEDWPGLAQRRHLVRLWFRGAGRPFYHG